MLMWAAASLLLGASGGLSMPFLLPGELVDPRGVRLEAQIPEPGMELLPRDATRPSLWYAPVAARTREDGAVQLWYQRVNKGEEDYSDQRTLCLGEIRTGQWTLPALHPDAPAWGGPDNVCLRRSPYRPTWGGFNVFQIVDAEGKLQMLYWDQPDETGQAGAMRAVSTDGRAWEKLPGAVFTEHNDAFCVIHEKGEYILYQTALEPWPDKPYPDNLDKFKRVQSIRTSDNLNTWTPQEIFLRPDDRDPPETEFYLMKVFRYGGGYAGLIMKYYGDPANPNKHSAILKYELAVSEDTRTWERPYRATDLGFWSYADPFLMNGKMHFAIWKDGGMVTVAYPPNRLVAAVADGEGSFMTRPFERPEGMLALNADASHGWIEVELLDGAGKPVTGAQAQRIENTEGEQIPLQWSQDTLPEQCILRLQMRDAKVFAVVSGS